MHRSEDLRSLGQGGARGWGWKWHGPNPGRGALRTRGLSHGAAGAKEALLRRASLWSKLSHTVDRQATGRALRAQGEQRRQGDGGMGRASSRDSAMDET